MSSVRRVLPLLLPTVLLVAAPSAFGADRLWQFSVFAGYQQWKSLADLNPETSGSFDKGGWLLGGAVHRSVGVVAKGDVAVGIELGAFPHESSIPGLDKDLYARGMYLTPTVEWSRPVGGDVRVDVDGGVGYYLVDFVELICGAPCVDAEEVFEKGRLGGFVGLGIEPFRYSWGTIFAQVRVHFVDFGQVQELGPDAGRLDGPIWMLGVGARFGR